MTNNAAASAPIANLFGEDFQNRTGLGESTINHLAKRLGFDAGEHEAALRRAAATYPATYPMTSKTHPFQGLPGPGRDGAKVKKFHNFATDDAPLTPHRCTSITPPSRALDEILHLT